MIGLNVATLAEVFLYMSCIECLYITSYERYAVSRIKLVKLVPSFIIIFKFKVSVINSQRTSIMCLVKILLSPTLTKEMGLIIWVVYQKMFLEFH